MYFVLSAQTSCGRNHQRYAPAPTTVKIAIGHVTGCRSVLTTPASASISGTNPRTITTIVRRTGIRLRGYGCDGSPCRPGTEKKLMSLHVSACSVVHTL